MTLRIMLMVNFTIQDQFRHQAVQSLWDSLERFVHRKRVKINQKLWTVRQLLEWGGG